MPDILEFCEAQLEWTVQLTAELAEAESPSTDKPALDRCAALLVDRLAACGASVQRLPQPEAGDHVRAEFFDGDRQVLLLGHFDTVWDVGQIRTMPLRRDADRLFGPGVFDMKAGIAIGMLAARAMAACQPPGCRVVMLWTSDEEVGSRSSRPLIEEEARRSDAVFVLEPSLPGGAVKTRRKGVGQFDLTVRGVLAHAGIDPGKGASAIHELARQIVRIEGLQDLSRGISVNVGIVAGGTRPNVIADQARATIDVRVACAEDAKAVERALRGLTPAIPGTSLVVDGGFERPPMERRDGVAWLYGLACEAAAALGRALGEGQTGGASDGNFTAALGVPTLDGLGAVGDGAHAALEHVVISDLPWRAALLAHLVARVARTGRPGTSGKMDA